MNIKASIDIGSNSILLLLIESKKEDFKILENHSYITGLGRDLDTNKLFIDEAMKDSLEVLDKYADLCTKYGLKPENVIVTATEASRVAKNASKFFGEVKKKTGLRVQIITSEAEAYYSTTGILIDKKITDSEIVIMDIGGASTELIRVERESKKILDSFSMPVGAVRMNNWHLLGSRDHNLQEVLHDFSSRLKNVKCKTLYCVAGTMTSLGNIYLKNKTFIEDEVNGLHFSVGDLKTIQNEYQKSSANELLTLFPFLGKRSQTIVSGMMLANAIIDNLGIKNIYISTYGLRYGTVMVDSIPSHFLVVNEKP